MTASVRKSVLTPQVTSTDLKQVGMPQASLQHTDLRGADLHKANLRLRDSRLTRHAGLSRCLVVLRSLLFGQLVLVYLRFLGSHSVLCF